MKVKRTKWEKIVLMDGKASLFVDVIKLSVCLSRIEKEEQNFELVLNIYKLFGTISQRERLSRFSTTIYELTVEDAKNIFAGIENVEGLNTSELFLTN